MITVIEVEEEFEIWQEKSGLKHNPFVADSVIGWCKAAFAAAYRVGHMAGQDFAADAITKFNEITKEK